MKQTMFVLITILLGSPYSINLSAQNSTLTVTPSQIAIGEMEFLGDLTVYKNDEPASLVIGSDAGRLHIGTAASNAAFSSIATAGDAVFQVMGNGNDNNLIFNLGTDGSSSNGNRKIYFGDETNPKTLVVSNAGKVGIGTEVIPTNSVFAITGNTYMNGKLEAKRIDATEVINAYDLYVRPLPFPDYVFAADYDLLPLADLKAYIAQHQHLPNIPSAEAIAEAGKINVGELQIQQMEKIEELTLYILQLQEKIDRIEGALELQTKPKRSWWKRKG